jgi:hypothetical protein
MSATGGAGDGAGSYFWRIYSANIRWALSASPIAQPVRTKFAPSRITYCWRVGSGQRRGGSLLRGIGETSPASLCGSCNPACLLGRCQGGRGRLRPAACLRSTWLVEKAYKLPSTEAVRHRLSKRGCPILCPPQTGVFSGGGICSNYVWRSSAAFCNGLVPIAPQGETTDTNVSFTARLCSVGPLIFLNILSDGQ